MATNKLQWKRIAKGDKLPCQSFLRKKNGEILKLSTGAGVTVGQDAYYLPVDEVIEEIKNYPIEENEDEKIKQELIEYHKAQAFLDGKPNNKHVKFVAWLEKQGDIPTDAVLDSNKDGLIADTIRYKREKQGEQKHQYNSRPRYVGEEELLGTNKQGKCPFLKQELIDMGFAFTQDGDLAYPIHKIEKKEFAAWSEEDEENSKNILYILNQLKGNAIYSEDKIAENCIDWFSSLKDRVQPQPKQEWSEEDEKNFARVDYACLKVYGGDSYSSDWLRKFLGIHKKWKPSEEQMVALKCAITTADEKWVCMNTKDLESLYEDLMKLMEE